MMVLAAQAAFFAARRPRKDSPHTTDAYRRDLAGITLLSDGTVLAGTANGLWVTRDGGQSWNVISPDLSTQDPSRIVPSGVAPSPSLLIGTRNAVDKARQNGVGFIGFLR